MINGIDYKVFLKFGKKENLEKLQTGNIYMKEAKYFRELETMSGMVGMGDKYDSCTVQRDVPIWINGVKIPNADWFVGTNTMDEKTPIFCCTCLKEKDFIYDSLKKEYVVDSTIFNIEKLKKNFGEFVLVIPYPEFFVGRINKYCKMNDLDFRFKEVTYVDYNDKDKSWLQEYKNDLSHFFIKEKSKFMEQKEFRMLLANVFTEEQKDYYCMNIPEGFEDFTMILPTEKVVTISYVKDGVDEENGDMMHNKNAKITE